MAPQEASSEVHVLVDMAQLYGLFSEDDRRNDYFFRFTLSDRILFESYRSRFFSNSILWKQANKFFVNCSSVDLDAPVKLCVYSTGTKGTVVLIGDCCFTLEFLFTGTFNYRCKLNHSQRYCATIDFSFYSLQYSPMTIRLWSLEIEGSSKEAILVKFFLSRCGRKDVPLCSVVYKSELTQSLLGPLGSRVLPLSFYDFCNLRLGLKCVLSVGGKDVELLPMTMYREFSLRIQKSKFVKSFDLNGKQCSLKVELEFQNFPTLIQSRGSTKYNGSVFKIVNLTTSLPTPNSNLRIDSDLFFGSLPVAAFPPSSSSAAIEPLEISLTFLSCLLKGDDSTTQNVSTLTVGILGGPSVSSRLVKGVSGWSLSSPLSLSYSTREVFELHQKMIVFRVLFKERDKPFLENTRISLHSLCAGPREISLPLSDELSLSVSVDYHMKKIAFLRFPRLELSTSIAFDRLSISLRDKVLTSHHFVMQSGSLLALVSGSLCIPYSNKADLLNEAVEIQVFKNSISFRKSLPLLKMIEDINYEVSLESSFGIIVLHFSSVFYTNTDEMGFYYDYFPSETPVSQGIYGTIQPHYTRVMSIIYQFRFPPDVQILYSSVKCDCKMILKVQSKFYKFYNLRKELVHSFPLENSCVLQWSSSLVCFLSKNAFIVMSFDADAIPLRTPVHQRSTPAKTVVLPSPSAPDSVSVALPAPRRPSVTKEFASVAFLPETLPASPSAHRARPSIGVRSQTKAADGGVVPELFFPSVVALLPAPSQEGPQLQVGVNALALRNIEFNKESRPSESTGRGSGGHESCSKSIRGKSTRLKNPSSSLSKSVCLRRSTATSSRVADSLLFSTGHQRGEGSQDALPSISSSSFLPIRRPVSMSIAALSQRNSPLPSIATRFEHSGTPVKPSSIVMSSIEIHDTSYVAVEESENFDDVDVDSLVQQAQSDADREVHSIINEMGGITQGEIPSHVAILDAPEYSSDEDGYDDYKVKEESSGDEDEGEEEEWAEASEAGSSEGEENEMRDTSPDHREEEVIGDARSSARSRSRTHSNDVGGLPTSLDISQPRRFLSQSPREQRMVDFGTMGKSRTPLTFVESGLTSSTAVPLIFSNRTTVVEASPHLPPPDEDYLQIRTHHPPGTDLLRVMTFLRCPCGALVLLKCPECRQSLRDFTVWLCYLCICNACGTENYVYSNGDPNVKTYCRECYQLVDFSQEEPLHMCLRCDCNQFFMLSCFKCNADLFLSLYYRNECIVCMKHFISSGYPLRLCKTHLKADENQK